MYRTLFYIPLEIGGLPVFGVGLLLAAWLIVGVVLLCLVAWKEGIGREWFSYLPLLALVAAVIIWVLPHVCIPGRGLAIRGNGMMMLLAVVSGTSLFVWRARRAGLSPDLMLSMVFWMFLAGLIGARVFYVIEYWPDFQKPTLGATLGAVANVTMGGLVVYGSLVGGLAAMVVFLRKHRLRVLPVCDLLAPCLVLGLAIGRVGCLLNGCCYGGACERAWALRFPVDSAVYESQVARGQFHGMTLSESPKEPPVVLRVEPSGPAERAGLRVGDRIVGLGGYRVESARDATDLLFSAYHGAKPLEILTAEGRQIQVDAVPVAERSLPVSPTQPLASLNAIVIFLFLLACEPFCRRDGQLFALLLTIYPITRFLLEIIRTDENAVFGTGLSISQNASLLFLVLIAALWVYIFRQPRAMASPSSSGPA